METAWPQPGGSHGRGAQPLGCLPRRSPRNCPVTLFQLGTLHAICLLFHRIISLCPGHSPRGRGCLPASRAPPRARGIFLRHGRKAPLLLLSVAASCVPISLLWAFARAIPSSWHPPLTLPLPSGGSHLLLLPQVSARHHLLLEAFPELKPCSLDWTPPPLAP